MFKQIDEITSLKGVGAKTATPFFDIGITTIDDLICNLPISYITYTANELIDNSNVIITGTIISNISEYRPRSNLTITNFTLSDGVNNIKVVAWNQRHLKFALKNKMNVEVTGKYDQQKNQITLKTVKEVSNLSNSDKIVAVYSKIDKISNPKINKLILQAINTANLDDEDRNMLTILHNPTNAKELTDAQLRFKQIEFTNYYQKIQNIKSEARRDERFKLDIDMNLINDFISSLPYSLTVDQQKAINAGLYSLNAESPMQSLILGDVGSGKTIVALTLALAAIHNDMQVAIMLPTEILAKQVYEIVDVLFSKYRSALLTSSVKLKDKKLIKSMLQTGSVDIVIGTQALIEDDVEFKNLGFVVIDEQHRFGVNQRQMLVNKGEFTNYCYLSATPIPRTFAHYLYGVIDVIEINSKPDNRKPITTNIFKPSQKQKVMDQVISELKLGNQVFVVTPLAYEVEDMNIADSMSTYESFNTYFKDEYHVGVINGQLKSEHKDIIMNDFKNRKYDILVATTVIEVGVDIPGATCIVVLNAERFGLATLHQLRGRVGRNDLKSVCLLCDESNNEESYKRLKLMETIDNGYELAKIDYEMRGAGELTGIRQSGNEDFILFNFADDWHIAEKYIKTLS